ncbi:MAG: AAA family ATPase [Bacteroidota bacterium]|jgi:hypothetical protein
MNTKTNREQYIAALSNKFSDKIFKRKELNEFNSENGYTNVGWFINDDKYKVAHGKYSLAENSIQSSISVTALDAVKPSDSDNLVPKVDPHFVKHGEFNLLLSIIKSKKFYPIFITGLSGNGKTFSVEQACAKSNRSLYRVNITIETDEDDLLGGFRLVNDCTKWFDGPVIRAMKTGSVLLLDEVDLGSNKLLCLQPILEGKGIFLKKINQFIEPQPGFTVIATANTKGQGSESGKFIGTNILNEAFLERFCATIEQNYPTESVEKNILSNIFSSNGIGGEHTSDFILKLVMWANGIRKTYNAGGVNDIISTRRLVHIANAYAILGHPKADGKSVNEYKNEIYDVRRQAIQLCISRFDEYTKMSFMELYDAIDQYKKVPVEPEADAPDSIKVVDENSSIYDILNK